MVWGDEVAGDAEPSFKSFVGMELGTDVVGDGFEEDRFSGDEPGDGYVGVSCSPVKDFGDPGQVCLALNQGEDTLESVGSHHGIAFLMAELGTIVTACWADTDTKLSFDPTSIILCLITLSSAFWYDSQLPVELSTSASVLLDSSIDCRNADESLPASAKRLLICWGLHCNFNSSST